MKSDHFWILVIVLVVVIAIAGGWVKIDVGPVSIGPGSSVSAGASMPNDFLVPRVSNPAFSAAPSATWRFALEEDNGIYYGQAWVEGIIHYYLGQYGYSPDGSEAVMDWALQAQGGNATGYQGYIENNFEKADIVYYTLDPPGMPRQYFTENSVKESLWSRGYNEEEIDRFLAQARARGGSLNEGLQALARK